MKQSEVLICKKLVNQFNGRSCIEMAKFLTFFDETKKNSKARNLQSKVFLKGHRSSSDLQ